MLERFLEKQEKTSDEAVNYQVITYRKLGFAVKLECCGRNRVGASNLEH